MTNLCIKRVVLCADGDPGDVNLWSNIPYLLGAEVERQDVELIRVNLKAPWLIRRLWRYTIGIRHKIRHWNTSYDFYRSRTNHWLTTSKLNQVARMYSGTGTILINLSISTSPTCSSIPVVLLSDWSYHYYITERLGRQPVGSELATINRDNAAMERASLVVLLFPESAARLQQVIPSGRFRFLGHVINDHPLAPPPPHEDLADNHQQIRRLLFVGRPRYLKGLELLLQAMALLPHNSPVQLDVVGISEVDLISSITCPFPVNLHGYLSKGNLDQREMFYNLLNHADLIINSSPLWAGFSATVEAMYRKTAVLTAPYSEFQAIFGRTLLFGSYLSVLTPSSLASAIVEEIRDPKLLATKKLAAHQAVQEFSWKHFLDRLLEELASC